ncbi:glycoside hydrolase, partial [Pelagophyceae sp. CCMP2097]
MQDAGQGFRTHDARLVGHVTSWPCALALASAWDAELVAEWATAAADEFLDKGANLVLGPGLNVHRVARGGRNAEYLSGEDPLLGASFGSAFARAFQSKRVLVAMKHFALNQQETHRETVDAVVSARALFEVYYWPFQACVDAGAAAAMCAYNRANGDHACNSSGLLIRDLRGTMG